MHAMVNSEINYGIYMHFVSWCWVMMAGKMEIYLSDFLYPIYIPKELLFDEQFQLLMR